MLRKESALVAHVFATIKLTVNPHICMWNHTMLRRLSTSAAASFKKESVTQFNNLVKAAASPKKWQPTTGDSFRSFAEYRLKVVNQSPLVVRSKPAQK